MGFSLLVSKKVPATWCDFCSWFQKKCLLPGGIFIFFFRFWNLKLDFFPIEKVFRKTAKTKNFSTLELIMSEISANLKNIFWPRKPPILKLEVGFFSDRKRFSQIFENRIFFFHLKFISIKKKIREPFLIGREGGREGAHHKSQRYPCVPNYDD